MPSQPWTREHAFAPHRTTGRALVGLLGEADRLLADARIVAVSATSRHALAHGAVVLFAKLALAAAGHRTTGSHHYWGVESLRHTVGLADEELAVLHAHRGKRHEGFYGASGTVTESELADLLARADDLRGRVLAWLASEHADLWPNDTVT